MKEKALRGERLRQRRENLGLSQQDLADRLGAHVNLIYKYESGKVDPSALQLKHLAKELSVPIDWLVGLRDQPQGPMQEHLLTPAEQRFLQSWRDGNLRALIDMLQQAPPDKQE
jgi:transcriptional regulator with XRE-family HTH domain